MEWNILLQLSTTLGLGSILGICVNKWFSRKLDKVDLTEKQLVASNKVIDSLQKRLDIYIDLLEKATKDIAVLQERIQKIYPLTCGVIDCKKRILMDSSSINACITMNNSNETA